MQTTFKYRPVTAGDLEQLKALALISYGQYAPQLSTENAELFKSSLGNIKTWTTLLGMSNGIVCLHQEEIIGMAFLISAGNPWDIFKAEWAYIRMLGIDPRYEGQGIARALINRCIANAKAAHEKTLALHTSEMMHAARHIYETSGFKVLHEIEPRYGKRYWIYTLDLSV
jgi:GNAT superfamily N-acetyltransferase